MQNHVSGQTETIKEDSEPVVLSPERSRIRDPGRLRSFCTTALFLQAVALCCLLVWFMLREWPAAPNLTTMIARARPATVGILTEGPPRISRQKLAFAGTDPGAHSVESGGLAARGSGFAIDRNGYVVTNAHVVRGATRVAVRLDKGRVLDAEIAGVDYRTDVALLRIDGRAVSAVIDCFSNVPPAIGARVVAIGDPFGLAGSVSAGIVSAHGRGYGDVDPVDYIQHDAAVNKGNSGGPLLDEAGCVVGINTAIPDETWANAGIAFATPAAIVREVVNSFRDGKPLTRAWMGVGVQQIDEPLRDSLGLHGYGLVVTEVEPGSPVAAIGLQIGDVLTHLDDLKLRKVRDLSRPLLRATPGATIRIRVLRAETARLVEVRLGGRAEAKREPPTEIVSHASDADERSEPGAVRSLPSSDSLFGLRFETRPPALGSSATSTAVVLSGTVPDSPAAAAGLRVGDIVLAVGTAVVHEAGEARQRLAAANEAVAVLVFRPGDRRQYIVLNNRRGRVRTAMEVAVIGGPF